MKINNVFIKRGFEERTFEFGNKINLIYSKENSKGKTTLLRLILHGLGYNIPATDGVKTFDNFYVKIEFEKDGNTNTIERFQGNNIKIIIKNTEHHYVVPEQLDELHALMFDISDIMILDNLLAIYYIDQEKGWTLLNRGIIIGKNRFNIENFISALSDKDVAQTYMEIDKIKDETRKYKYLKNIAEYKKETAEDEIISYTKKDNAELFKQKTLFMTKKHEIDQEIKEIDQILKDNKKLIEYIEKLEIHIKISEEKNMKLTKENILNYNDNQIYYETRKKALEIKQFNINKELTKIQKEIDDRNVLFDIKSILDEVNESLNGINIKESEIDAILDKLNKKKENLMTILRSILANDNKYLISIFQTIKKYGVELGIEKYINEDIDFVLTNQLKGKSGKILTQMSFIFKIAYLLEIKNKYNLTLPIIIDSPRTNELTDEASTAMLKILERDFSDHQVIFASVYEFKEITKSVIEMKENLFN